MTRKQFLRSTAIAAAGLTAVGGGGTLFFQHKTSHQALAQRSLRFQNLDEARAELQRLAAIAEQNLRIANEWSLAENAVHLAQSIEFSMTGYPQAKPVLFQQTVGKWAFQRFSRQGYMAHNLNEEIPGAPPLRPDDTAAAVRRLELAIENFEQFEGHLQPHFAYGSLDKKAYAQAHAFHLADHFAAMIY